MVLFILFSLEERQHVALLHCSLFGCRFLRLGFLIFELLTSMNPKLIFLTKPVRVGHSNLFNSSDFISPMQKRVFRKLEPFLRFPIAFWIFCKKYINKKCFFSWSSTFDLKSFSKNHEPDRIFAKFVFSERPK